MRFENPMPDNDPKQEIDLGAIAEENLGSEELNQEALPRGIEPGDWVSVKHDRAAELGEVHHVQVVGTDPEKPGNVFIPGPEGVRSVPSAYLEGEDIKAVERQMETTQSQYEGAINRRDQAAMEQYRREVAEGKRKPGDMSGLGM